MTLQRETWFRCGSTGFRVGLVVKGQKGAVQFWLSAYPERGAGLLRRFNLTPVDLGYHAKEPQYEGQEPMSQKCDLLGCPCYYDGTSLGASDLFDQALALGEDAIWQKLEEVYRDRFGEET